MVPDADRKQVHNESELRTENNQNRCATRTCDNKDDSDDRKKSVSQFDRVNRRNDREADAACWYWNKCGCVVRMMNAQGRGRNQVGIIQLSCDVLERKKKQGGFRSEANFN